jgi:transposase-like protein
LKNEQAAMRFFDQAMRDNAAAEKVTMDKSGANKAAIDQVIDDKGIPIMVRRVRYLNNIESRTIVRSSASPKRCSDFKPFSPRGTSSPALNWST